MRAGADGRIMERSAEKEGVMAAAGEGLEEIVREYHHVQAEHRRAGPEGTGRRHLHERLDELEKRFERLLADHVGDEETRSSWRMRLHHGTEPPAEGTPAGPLAFKGRSSGGSLVEIRERPQGDYDVELDGVPVGILAGEIDFSVYEIDGREFFEHFDAGAAALLALAGWVDDPSGEPPWEHLHPLLEDGLVDRHFGLTARGRRALSEGAR
jgi:hypothetical protein